MEPALRRFFATVGALALVPAWLAAQQPAVISGQVTGADERPLPGATVAIAQLGIGATSRDDGRYTILVPAARVTGGQVSITARAINFKPQTVTVTLAEGQITQDFALAPNPLNLGEIVVTGAGTASEVEKLGTVRDRVVGEQVINSAEQNLVNTLAAKAPNVQVYSSAGILEPRRTSRSAASPRFRPATGSRSSWLTASR